MAADVTGAPLATAPFEVVGRFADASNATLLVRLLDEEPEPLADTVTLDDLDPTQLAVYKPERGEAPLWDFPPGTLHRREVAAHVVSEALGWGLVPDTTLRSDGPYGAGSLQRYVPHDPQDHYFTLRDDPRESVQHQLRALVLFDLVIDNADRKSGHVMLETREDATAPVRLRGVDHGVSFHVHRKLRTVMWDFAHEPVDPGLREDVAHLLDLLDDGASEVARRLTELLSAGEPERLRERVADVVAMGAFPPPIGPRPFPWPLV